MRRKCRIWISMLLVICVLLTSMSVCEVVASEKKTGKAQEEVLESTEEKEVKGEKESTEQEKAEEQKESTEQKNVKEQKESTEQKNVKEQKESTEQKNAVNEPEKDFADEREEEPAEEREENDDRRPVYDEAEVNRILSSISEMNRINEEENVETYASAGETVETQVLRTDIGTISMIRHTESGWENLREWSEGMLGTSNGEWAYCADPTVGFQSGTKRCYNAATFYSDETIKTIGMMFYYFDTQVKCAGMSDADIYLLKQCVLWSVLNNVNGWYPGITLDYGNGVKDASGHWLADHLGKAVDEAAVWVAKAENRKDFKCSGIIMKGDGQDLSQWEYEYNPKGKLCIQKASDAPEITKNNACYSLAGAEYGVYTDKTCKNLAVALKTDAEGKSNTVELAKATYYLKEIKAPKGFAVSTSVQDVTVISGETNTVKVSDRPQVNPVDIVLGKRDQDTNSSKPQGSASLANAEFTVKYYDGYYDADPASQGKTAVRTWKLKTDTNGRAKLEESYKISGGNFFTDSEGNPSLPLGTVTIRETKAPKGYLINQEVFIKKITSDGTKETLAVYNAPTIKEKVMRGDVQLTKFAEDKDAQEEKKIPLEGIKFKLISKTNGQSWTIVTDKNGFASTRQLKISDHGNLPYDTYIISESNTPKEYKRMEDFEVTISEDNQTLSYIVENKLILSPVRLIKKDAVTGNVIPVADAEFQLLDRNKEVITMNTYYPKKETIDTFKTDATGSFVLPEKLKVGTYYFHELTAPVGYLKGEDVEFEITAGHQWEDPFIVEFSDQPVMGRIEVLKTDAETKEVLQGAEFEVTAAEEICSGDGSVIFENGDVVGNMETGEDGKAVMDGLYLGAYLVREVKAPEGYLLSDVEYAVTLEYEDQTVPIITETVDVEDEPTRIKLIKTDRESGKPLGNVTFAVWNKESGEETAKEYETDSEGVIEIARLAPGVYCIQETKTVPGYVLDTSVYEMEISEDGKIDGKETGVLELANSPTVIIGTKARDEVGTVRKKMEQIDVVEMKNLQIGASYLIKGILMDKETKKTLLINGQTVTAEKQFVASVKEDTMEMVFRYDGSNLYGKSVVFFEKLYVEHENDFIEISTHEDLNDEMQTLTYPEKTPSKEEKPEKTTPKKTTKKTQPEKTLNQETSAAKTGDIQKPLRMMLFMAVSGGIFISIFLKNRMRKRKNRNQKK